MNDSSFDESLKSLLVKADQAAGEPAMMPADAADRVRSLDRTRRNRRRMVVAACGLFLLIGAAIVAARWSSPIHQVAHSGHDLPGATSVEATAEAQNAVDVSEQEIAERFAERLANIRAEVELFRRDLAELNRLAGDGDLPPEPNDALSDESVGDSLVDRTEQSVNAMAGILVFDAQQREARTGDKAAALERYRRIVELFPDALAAQPARERIAASGMN